MLLWHCIFKRETIERPEMKEVFIAFIVFIAFSLGENQSKDIRKNCSVPFLGALLLTVV